MKNNNISRRQTLLAISSVLGASLFPFKIFSGESSPLDKWRVGRSVGGIRPITELRFDDMKKAGFDCIEISISDRSTATMDDATWLQWFKDLQKTAKAIDLEVRSVHIPFGKTWDISDLDENIRKKAVEKCIRYFDLVDVLGAKIYIVHPSYEPIKTEDRPKRIECCIESLKVLAAVARDKNAKIALENLPRTCLGNTSKEILHILDAVDVPEGLQICFDSNHTLQEKPEEFVAVCGKRIITTHMSDFDGIDEKHWLPYEGIINWNAVMTELVKAGYVGPFVFETGKFKDRSASNPEITEVWNKVKRDYVSNR